MLEEKPIAIDYTPLNVVHLEMGEMEILSPLRGAILLFYVNMAFVEC